jgi:hypothetical protein
VFAGLSSLPMLDDPGSGADPAPNDVGTESSTSVPLHRLAPYSPGSGVISYSSVVANTTALVPTASSRPHEAPELAVTIDCRS